MTFLEFIHQHFFGVALLLVLLGYAIFQYAELRARLRK